MSIISSSVEISTVVTGMNSLSELSTKIFDIGKAAVELKAEFDNINTKMLAVTGSAKAAASEMAYLQSTTNKLGLEFNSTAKSFLGFEAAAKLSGVSVKDAREIFENMSIASGKLGLSMDETNGIFKALEQMFSKGTVTLEELKGQIGERMPGALGLMAQSLGVTEAKLLSMISKGEVGVDSIKKWSETVKDTFTQGANSVEAMNKQLDDIFQKTELSNEKLKQTFSDITSHSRDFNTEAEKILETLAKEKYIVDDLTFAYENRNKFIKEGNQYNYNDGNRSMTLSFNPKDVLDSRDAVEKLMESQRKQYEQTVLNTTENNKFLQSLAENPKVYAILQEHLMLTNEKMAAWLTTIGNTAEGLRILRDHQNEWVGSNDTMQQAVNRLTNEFSKLEQKVLNAEISFHGWSLSLKTIVDAITYTIGRLSGEGKEYNEQLAAQEKQNAEYIKKMIDNREQLLSSMGKKPEDDKQLGDLKKKYEETLAAADMAKNKVSELNGEAVALQKGTVIGITGTASATEEAVKKTVTLTEKQQEALKKLVPEKKITEDFEAAIKLLGKSYEAHEIDTQKYVDKTYELRKKYESDLKEAHQKELEILNKHAVDKNSIFAKMTAEQSATMEYWANKRGISPELVKGVVAQESSFDPNAYNKSGATGLMQIMPIAAKDVGANYAEMKDMAKNIEAGTAVLTKALYSAGGDIDKALAFYNMGEGGTKRIMAKHGGVFNLEDMPKDVQDYVHKVKGYIAEAKAIQSGESGLQQETDQMQRMMEIRQRDVEKATREAEQAANKEKQIIEDKENYKLRLMSQSGRLDAIDRDDKIKMIEQKRDAAIAALDREYEHFVSTHRKFDDLEKAMQDKRKSIWDAAEKEITATTQQENEKRTAAVDRYVSQSISAERSRIQSERSYASNKLGGGGLAFEDQSALISQSAEQERKIAKDNYDKQLKDKNLSAEQKAQVDQAYARNLRAIDSRMTLDMKQEETTRLKNSNNLMDNLKADWTDTTTLMGGMFQNFANISTSALNTFMQTGKFNFRQFSLDIIKMIEEMIVKMLVMKAIQLAVGGIGGLFGGGATAGIQSAGTASLGQATSGASMSSAITPSFASGSYGDGGVFDGGYQLFADGGMVNSPTPFATAYGRGLMGEKAPEAILPLERDNSGKLGVRANQGDNSGQSISVGQVQIVIQSKNNKPSEDGMHAAKAFKEQMKAIAKQEITNSMRTGNRLNPITR